MFVNLMKNNCSWICKRNTILNMDYECFKMKLWKCPCYIVVLLILFEWNTLCGIKVHGFKVDATLRLLHNFTDSNFKYIRPGIDSLERTALNVTLNLVAISEVNEVKSYISVLGFLNVTWVETRFSWDPEDYDGVTDITLASNQVWVPSFIVGNPSDSVTFYRDVATDVKFSYDGRATWMPGALTKPFCAMNVYVYPFDQQICEMFIVAASVESEYLELVSTVPEVATNFYSKNSEWELTRTWTSTTMKYDTMSFLHFHFEIARKPGFLVMNLVFPVGFLSFLNAMVFVLPAESGERISFAVTIFLSYFVFITLVIQSIPKISDPIPLLCFYIMAMVCSSGLIIVAIICNLKLHFQPVSSKVTPTIRNIVTNFGKYRPFNNNAYMTASVQYEDTAKTANGGCSVETANDISWRDVSGCIDKLLFYILLILDIVMLVGLLWYMSSYYDN